MVRTSNQLKVTLSDGSRLNLPPFAYIRPEDQLIVKRAGEDLLGVEKIVRPSVRNKQASVQVFPPYRCWEEIFLPPHVLRICFRERINQTDWKSAKTLEKFHYRGKGLNKIVGRRTVLMVEAEGIGIIGYGVLAATVAVAKPRFDLFQTNFSDQMKSKLINQIARIPRVVIHPEFRGLGVGARLAAHLVKFATRCWDINGYRPILIEVIASMTEYHRFFQAAGFIEFGHTQGYDKGILPHYGEGDWAARPNVNRYSLFECQGPKPYLVFPMTQKVKGMLKTRGTNPEPAPNAVSACPLLEKSIRIRRLSIAYKPSNGVGLRSAKVKEVFDVDSSQLHSPILDGFSLSIDPGDVVLFTGASGSGKSTLIKILSESSESLSKTMTVDGELYGLDRGQVSVLNSDWDEAAPLVDQVGESFADAIRLLNGIGLAEAHLYVKSPQQISEGQRYRFAIARLCDSNSAIWVGDDFASSLDPRTSALVARGIRKNAATRGATLVLAAPHVGYFLPSLAPTKLVHLHWGGKADVLGARLVFRLTGEGLEVSVSNIGRGKLTKIQVLLVKARKKRTNVFHRSGITLEASERSEPFFISRHQLRGVSYVLLTTREGVGDVIYFAPTTKMEH